MIRKAQNLPITKESILANGETNVEKSTFDKVIDVMGGIIPSIYDIANLIGKFI